MTALFYTAGAVALIGAILAVTGRHAIHALLCLLVALQGLALAVFALGAPYAAILLVIIYAGAIMMLFLIAGFIGTIFISMVLPIFTLQDYIK